MYNADYIKNSFTPGTVYMAVIPALRTQRQEDTHNFKASIVWQRVLPKLLTETPSQRGKKKLE